MPDRHPTCGSKQQTDRQHGARPTTSTTSIAEPQSAPSRPKPTAPSRPRFVVLASPPSPRR
ncbi:hypothetical protein BC567DRAFT_227983 [Phyllosticta citribraziliensis]